jgi:uncharacterized protein YecT (DUF1311 family)
VADDLAVPQEVLEEFEAGLDDYIEAWTADVRSHVEEYEDSEDSDKVSKAGWEDVERDEHGRWTGGGTMHHDESDRSKLTPAQRAWVTRREKMKERGETPKPPTPKPEPESEKKEPEVDRSKLSPAQKAWLTRREKMKEREKTPAPPPEPKAPVKLEPPRFKNPQEAKQWIQNNFPIQGVAFRSDENMALVNNVAGALAYAHNEGHTVWPKEISVQDTYPGNSSAAASMAWPTSRLAIYRESPVWRGDSVSNHAEVMSNFRTGWWSNDNKYAIVLHELGHAAHGQSLWPMGGLPKVEFRENYGSIRPLEPAQERIAYEISRYAATNRSEYVAEMYSGILAGRRDFSSAAIRQYEEFKGPAHGKVLNVKDKAAAAGTDFTKAGWEEVERDEKGRWTGDGSHAVRSKELTPAQKAWITRREAANLRPTPEKADIKQQGKTFSSVSDAEKYATDNLGMQSAKLGKDVEVANRVVSGLSLAKSLGYEIPPKVVVKGTGDENIIAQLVPYAKPVLEINADHRVWKSPTALVNEYRSHWMSSGHPDGTIIHEVGHYQQIRTLGVDKYVAQGVKLTDSERAVAQQVSRYASTEKAEFVAEVFAGRVTGHVYSDAVNKLYDKLHGGVIGKTLPTISSKKSAVVASLRKSTPEIRSAQAELDRALRQFLKEARADVVKAVLDLGLGDEELGKADAGDLSKGRSIDGVVDKIVKIPWSVLPPRTAKTLKRITQASGQKALAHVSISSSDLLSDVNEVAGEWAETRAAEMVGMKMVNGQLATNPDAKWAISNTTRDDIRQIVTNAFQGRFTIKQLAEQIQQAGAFSDGRAAMIANTETALATSQGNLLGWQKSGIVKTVDIVTSEDHDDAADCECTEIAEAGPYPVNDAPMVPIHPNCWCVYATAELDGDVV